MNEQRTRTRLMISSAVLLLGAPAVLAWPLLWPVSQEADQTDTQTLQADNVPVVEPLKLEPDRLERVLAKRLQQKPRPAEPEVEPEPERQVVRKVLLPPSLRLIATMIESGKESALLATDRGEIQLCRVGDQLGDDAFEVVEIRSSEVVLRRDGLESTLEITASGG